FPLPKMAPRKLRSKSSVTKFNANDPKYKSIFCGIHIKICSAVIVLLSVGATMISFYREQSFYNLFIIALNVF
ncbi:hypothetical protein PMAYCL1PPCAC_22929, partial [Pristionchus mayeri]